MPRAGAAVCPTLAQDPSVIDTSPNIGAFYLDQTGTSLSGSGGHAQVCRACMAERRTRPPWACGQQDGASFDRRPPTAAPIVSMQFKNESGFQPTGGYYSLDVPGVAHFVLVRARRLRRRRRLARPQRCCQPLFNKPCSLLMFCLTV